MHQQASGAGGNYQPGHAGHQIHIQPSGYPGLPFVPSQTAPPQSSQAHLQQGQNAQPYVTGIYMSNIPPNVLLAQAPPQPPQPQVPPPTSQQAQHAQPQAQSQQQQSQQPVVQQQQPQQQQPQSQQPVMGALNPAAQLTPQQILAAQMLQQQQPHQPPTLQKRERKPLLIVNPNTKEPVKLDNISSTTSSSQPTPAHAPTATATVTTSSSSAPATSAAAASTDAQKTTSATAQVRYSLFFL